MNNDLSLPLRKSPYAIAKIRGSVDYPLIRGMARFYNAKSGVIATVRITGLPDNGKICNRKVFAVHIHSGGSCSGNETDYFADAMTHYNPQNCPHPSHAGDMPPLFGCGGDAFTAFLTDRFSADEIIGKTVIIHSSPDDFTTQPAGNSGTKIACGVIERYKK